MLRLLINIVIVTAAVGQNQPLANRLNFQTESPEKNAILRRFNYFDLELLQEFSETTENVFISPASIKMTLALILEGAKGKCATEIGNALRIDDVNHGLVRDLFSRLIYDLNTRSPNTVLQSSNAVFVSNKYKLLSQYQKKISEDYKATVESLDFSNADQAVKIINSWVSNATHNLIRDIVSNDNLFSETSILLTNALFFKGKWKTAFDEKITKLKCFNSPLKGCINTPMMQIADTFNYNWISELNAHAVELPYKDDNYAMLLLVPANGNDIHVLVRDIQHTRFNLILEQLRPSDIILDLPKFDIDYNIDLIQYLIPLKIQEIFDKKANLTGIVGEANVRISSMVHKTRIEVNEEGTKAAAVTSAIVIPLMGSTAQRIIADHPFVFFIYQKQSWNIIFEGILMEPKSHFVKPLETASYLYQQQYRRY